MIVDFLVTVFLGILNAVLGLIPTFTLWDPEDEAPRAVDGAIIHDGWFDQVASWVAAFDNFVPVEAMFGCLAAILGARLLVVIVQFLQWVWEQIPFKSA